MVIMPLQRAISHHLHSPEPTSGPFRNASIWRASNVDSTEAIALSFSRAYSLALSPQIIYSKSKLLSQLVSSQVYRQLEFQAVGNWWVYVPNSGSEPAQTATLKCLPNGREDIFEDSSIENRAKRSLMKFLKFVVDYENHAEIWDAHTDSGLPQFLASQFQLSPQLRTFIYALTLSMNRPEETPVGYSLPRIKRHLTSIGVLGPGFGAVVPKWGGSAEIAQVACRAGAVGGGVYMLGTGISSSLQSDNDAQIDVQLSNGETVKTKYLAHCKRSTSNIQPKNTKISRIIAVVSSPLTSLFENSVEGSPVPAVSVVAFPPDSLTSDSIDHTHPVYIIPHSSDAGECPAGQCLYPHLLLPFYALNDDPTYEYLSTLSEFL
jgi:RAB protein geranylgeranyltransferase component A